MKKFIAIICTLNILVLQCFAITPIDDRFETNLGYAYKVYVKDLNNVSTVFYSNKKIFVSSTTINQPINYYNDYFYENSTYYFYNDNLRFFYTDYENGIYTFQGLVMYWYEDQQTYDVGSYSEFYTIERTNIDIALTENGTFKEIYFSKDSALNLLPLSQNQLKVQSSILLALCFFIGLIVLKSLLTKRRYNL